MMDMRQVWLQKKTIMIGDKCFIICYNYIVPIRLYMCCYNIILYARRCQWKIVHSSGLTRT